MMKLNPAIDPREGLTSWFTVSRATAKKTSKKPPLLEGVTG
jgi:hypothetical protein